MSKLTKYVLIVQTHANAPKNLIWSDKFWLRWLKRYAMAADGCFSVGCLRFSHKLRLSSNHQLFGYRFGLAFFLDLLPEVGSASEGTLGFVLYLWIPHVIGLPWYFRIEILMVLAWATFLG